MNLACWAKTPVSLAQFFADSSCSRCRLFDKAHERLDVLHDTGQP
jgi:hypothetical protein